MQDAIKTADDAKQIVSAACVCTHYAVHILYCAPLISMLHSVAGLLA